MIEVRWEYIHDLNFDDAGNIARQNTEVSISDVGWAIFSFLIEPKEVSEVLAAKFHFQVTSAAASQLLNIGKLSYHGVWDCWTHGWNTSRFVVSEEPFGLYVEDSDALQSTGDKVVDLGHVAAADVASLLADDRANFFGVFMKGETADVASVASIANSDNNARPYLEIVAV